MLAMSELLKIEGALQRGGNTGADPSGCRESAAKLRRWLAAEQHPLPVRRKLEQLIGRFGNARFLPREQRSA